MKALETKNTISAAQTPAAPSNADAAPKTVVVPDNDVAPAAAKVSTDDAKQLGTVVDTGMKMAASERALRIQTLTQAVRSGTYTPNVSQLAEEILAQAELEARLARTLH